METNFNKLLLRTALVCMASDGEIAPEEVALIRKLCETMPEFQDMDFDAEADGFVTDINSKGKLLITEYLQDLEKTALTDEETIKLLDVAIQVIKADNIIAYSEIKFFKTIRCCLTMSDEQISASLSDKHEDLYLFLGDDIQTGLSLDNLTQQYLNTVEFNKFDFFTK